MMHIPDKMLALRKMGRKPGVDLLEVETPKLQTGEVLIEVKAGAICGTDFHYYRWNKWAASLKELRLPLTLGHECAGDVVAAGPGVNHSMIGQRVALETHIPCGNCYVCHQNSPHICQNLKMYGMHLDGCFARYTKAPASVAWPLPETVTYETGALLEPLGVAVRGLTTRPIKGQRILVLGCGPIGLFAILVARHLGASCVITADVNEYRLAMAKKAGAHMVLNAAADQVSTQVRLATDGVGVDLIFEASGNVDAIKDGFKALRKGGYFIMSGLPETELSINIAQQIVFGEATIKGIHGRKMFQTWEQMMQFLKDGLQVEEVITHKLPLTEYARAFKLLQDGNCGKIILTH